MKNKRENWIDYLRGMGAIFVLLGHLVSYSSKLKFYLYSFHMPLFFFISGYLFKYEKNYLKLFKKNLKKLILPYLFFGVLTIIIVVLLGEKIYFIDAVKGLSFFNGSFPWNTSLWFFIVLFYSIIITNIIVGIVKNNKCAFTFVFCINIIICYMIKRLNITLPFGINITFFSLIFYWLGYIIKNNYFHIKNIICKVYNYKLIIIPIVILFILSFYISYKNERIVMSQCIYPRFIIFIFLSMVGIFIYSFIAKKIRYGKILKIFSELSLIMFSTQRILFRFIDIISRKLDIVLIGSNNYIVVFIIFVVILLFYLLYYKIKKNRRRIMCKKTKGLIIIIVLFLSFFVFANSVYAQDGWVDENGEKYYYKDNNKLFGLNIIDDKKYIFDINDGKLLYGWIKYDNQTYYADVENGYLLSGINLVDGKPYFFGITKGKLMYGWIYYNGLIYYSDPTTGVLSSGVTNVNGTNYFFGLTKYKLMTTGLINANGTYYYTNSEGILQTGWKNVNGKYYYFNEDYRNATGWKEIDGLKYYFGEDGTRYQGIYIVDDKPYFFGITKGKLMYGWIYYNGLIYYSDPTTGVLSSGVTNVNGTNYFFGLTKYKLMTTGLINANGTYYYTNSEGILQTGWKNVNGKYYYFNEDYRNATGWKEIDGLKYYFGEDGTRYQGIYIVDDKPYFFGITKGKLMYGWIYYNGLIYYSDPTTGVLSSGVTNVNGTNYFFGLTKYKLMTTGLINANGTYYYTNSEGILQTGWKNVNGKYYYFNEDYRNATGWKEIDGLKYYFGEDGTRYQGIYIVDDKPYFFGITKGKLMYGWIYYNGLIYYSDPTTGVLSSGVTNVNGTNYFFGLTKYKLMTTGLINANGTYYYTNSEGILQTGWKIANNYCYYFKNDYSASTTSIIYNDVIYEFTDQGIAKLTGWNSIDGKRYYFNSGYMIIGTKVKQVIDISSHQGTISWNEVYNSGQIYGVIVRIGYMGSGNILKLDTQFINNINALKKYGIPYGLYFYSYAWNNNDAFLEASVINDVIYKYNLNPTLGIYWDLEEADYVARKNNLSVNQLGNLYDSMTRTFMNKINSNYKSGIYANLNYANNIFNEYTRQNLKWIAQWSNKCDFMYKYNLWQYSNNGSVPGIIGRVDLDYYYE